MPHNLKWNVVGSLLGMCLLGLAGCSDGGPALGEVSGTITLDGKPLSDAVISFFPENPEGSPSYGGSDAKGKYTLMFTREKYGAMLGKHRVQIETHGVSAEEAAEMKAEGQDAPAAYRAIPKKYREPGALTAEVNPGNNTIDFPLKSN